MQQWNRLSPVWKMTIWYLVILAALSLVFSIILYQMASAEIKKSIYLPDSYQRLFFDNDITRRARDDLYDSSIERLISNLFVFNIGVISFGGAFSYLLAKKTLRPIELALDSQTRFSSDVAHELRTPLAVMKSEIEVELKSQKPTLKQHQELLKSNLEEVNRLEKMTERLLLLANQNEITEKTIVSSRNIIDSAIEGLKFNAEKKSITMTNKSTDFKFQADSIGIHNALTILIDNAIKYSSEHTEITVSSRKKGNHVCLCVSDQGIGIDKNEQTKIFSRFYRVDESRSKLGVEGSGLGLSIAERITKQHGGHLEVSSRPGKGSTFTIVLPIA